MKRFSIIVPIYNVEKYLENCLKSIQNQTFKDFEVLMIDDGTKDNSPKIMNEFEKDERFKGFHKENGGLSDARNYGVERSNGEYLVFVDSDDEIEEDLLFNLNKEIEKNHPEVIKYGIKVIGKENHNEISASFSNLNGEEAFKKLILNDYFVTAWSFAYEKKFWIENDFSYTRGRYHEDFGLTPIIVLKSKKVSSIDYVGYRYFIRENSIMTDSSKTMKKAEDTLYFFDKLMEEVENISVSIETKKTFQSYVANVLICKSKSLEGKNRKEFLKELKERNIENYVLDDTYQRKIKKLILKVSLSFYVKYFV